MYGEKEFNLWINEYDQMVEDSYKENKYPFAGYHEVLDAIYKIVSSKQNPKVLDLGFGTGKLTTKLYEKGCDIYGQDFSEKMKELASNKMPNACLYYGDFTNGLVDELKKQKYDFIVSTYAMHHLNNEQKIVFINELLKQLNDDGQLLIGDISFQTLDEMNKCKKAALDDWDEEETYFVIDDFKKVFPKLTYQNISSCGGVISLTK